MERNVRHVGRLLYGWVWPLAWRVCKPENPDPSRISHLMHPRLASLGSVHALLTVFVGLIPAMFPFPGSGSVCFCVHLLSALGAGLLSFLFHSCFLANLVSYPTRGKPNVQLSIMKKKQGVTPTAKPPAEARL